LFERATISTRDVAAAADIDEQVTHARLVKATAKPETIRGSRTLKPTNMIVSIDRQSGPPQPPN
jgi:hypothetical protein